MGAEVKTEEMRANGYEIKKDNEITQDEVDLFESTEIKDPKREEMLEEGVAEKINKGLNMVLDQANNILNSYKEGEIPTADQVQALQIILRQSMNLEEGNKDDAENGVGGSAKKGKKVIAINGRGEDLMAVFGGKAEGYMSQRNLIEGKFGAKATALLDKIILGSGEAANDYIEESTLDKIKQGAFEKGEDKLYHINQEEAATFLKNTDRVNKADNPREFYEKLKKEKNSLLGENIIASIQSLLKVAQDGNLDSITKESISSWQEEHKNDEIFKSYNVNGKPLSEEQIVDGKLGIMTIRALIASGTEIRKTTYNVSDKMNMSGTAEGRDAREFDIDHDFDRMKTENESGLMYNQNLQKYGEWGDKGFQFKNGGIDGEGRKFVELNGNRLLEKGETEEGEGLFDTSRKLLRTYIDERGNEHPIYRDSLSMGDFKDNLLVKGQELILKDGKQILSTSFDRPKEKDGIVVSRIGVVRIGDEVDDNGDFRGKWRIDLFGEDDTKRLNKDQLHSLDHGDITHVLDQAIAAFKETHHKPSEVGRYNLNRIIDRVLSEVGKNAESAKILREIAGKDSFYGDGPKTRVENFFNLNDGLRSNLDHKIDRDDMTQVEKNVFKGMEKGMDHFDSDAENELIKKFKEDKLYDNKHTADNFRRWLVGNRIITRLEGLQTAYSKLKPKEEKQNQSNE